MSRPTKASVAHTARTRATAVAQSSDIERSGCTACCPESMCCESALNAAASRITGSESLAPEVVKGECATSHATFQAATCRAICRRAIVLKESVMPRIVATSLLVTAETGDTPEEAQTKRSMFTSLLKGGARSDSRNSRARARPNPSFKRTCLRHAA